MDFPVRNAFKILVVTGLVLVVIVQKSENKKEFHIRKGFAKWWFTSDPEDIRFFLFPNPDDEDYAEEIILGDELSLKGSQFNPGVPVIILIHGLLGNSHILTDVQLLKNAYLSIRYSANIIIVDYGDLAGTRLPFVLSPLNGILSIAAYPNVEIVAARIASFIFFLKNTGAISGPRNVHLIGHSVGCHVAGRTGNIVGAGMKSKIKRISGLDCPPLPPQAFGNALNKDNAFFVDVTHTSFGRFRNGFLDRIGHVDFYINGAGLAQPNCPNVFPFTDPYCHHVSSVFYFSKSIRNKNIFGCYCERCLLKPIECAEPTRYGHYTSTKSRGSFYVDIPQSRNP